MNTKTLVIGIIVIILIAAGLYFIVKSPSTAASPATTTTATTTADTTGASTTPQVQVQEVSAGTGAQAQPGSNVAVLYVGYVGTISTSTVFDSSAAHGNKPFTFTLGDSGNGAPIPGFQIGVNGMKVGGERLMAIPAALGYGDTGVKDANGNTVIPGGATIIFDVKLVSVAAPTSTSATTGTSAAH